MQFHTALLKRFNVSQRKIQVRESLIEDTTTHTPRRYFPFYSLIFIDVFVRHHSLANNQLTARQ